MILDPFVAILVALLIIKEAWELCKAAIGNLIDFRLTDEEEIEVDSVIRGVMSKYKEQLLDYHKLKTRKSGNKRHIDFHITVKPDLTVREAHDIVGCLKKEMNQKFLNTRVSIHIDPGEE